MAQVKPIEEMMEDYAITKAPMGYSGTAKSYFVMFGIAICIYYFTVGSVCVAMAGLVLGFIAAFLGAIIMCCTAWIFGFVSYREGYAFDMQMRLMGWGHRGTLIPSGINLFFSIFFWVAEAWWLAIAIQAAWPGFPMWAIYTLLTILFIIVPLFGHKAMAYWNWVAIPLCFISVIYILYYIYVIQGVSVASVLEFARTPLIPGGFGAAIDWAFLTVLFGWACTPANFSRFMTSRKWVWLQGPVFSITAMILMPLAGFFIIYPLVMTAFGVGGAGAAIPIAFSPSIQFVTAMGAIGALVVLAYQLNVQFINVYQPSIAISNLVDAYFHKSPPRWVWVIVWNLFGLGMLFAGVLKIFEVATAYLTVMGGSVILISIADLAYRKLKAIPLRWKWEEIRDVNPVAIIVFVISCAVGIVLWKAGFVLSASFAAWPLSFILYFIACYLTKGKYQQPADLK